jgi:hypothetical protein
LKANWNGIFAARLLLPVSVAADEKPSPKRFPAAVGYPTGKEPSRYMLPVFFVFFAGQ